MYASLFKILNAILVKQANLVIPCQFKRHEKKNVQIEILRNTHLHMGPQHGIYISFKKEVNAQQYAIEYRLQGAGDGSGCLTKSKTFSI